MSHNIIRNRFKRSPLPSNWDIAEALRNGDTTLDELAAVHGVKAKSIQRRLSDAGWSADGTPMQPWRETEPTDVYTCERCGIERRVKKAKATRVCFDCTQVERDLAQMGAVA